MILHTRHSPMDDREHGSISVLVAVLVPSLLLMLALLVDGTDRLRLQDHADAAAAEAARAGATAVDTRGPTITLDRTAALHAAQSALSASGHTGRATINGDAVHVSVSHHEPAPIGLLGPTLAATGKATAGLGTGTTVAGGLP